MCCDRAKETSLGGTEQGQQLPASIISTALNCRTAAPGCWQHSSFTSNYMLVANLLCSHLRLWLLSRADMVARLEDFGPVAS